MPIQADEPLAASATTFPRERIPKQPVLSAASFTRYSRSGSPSVLDAGEIRFVSRGSMAIALALQHAQIGKDDEVLLPAYHCISMIEPVVWRGALPVFYRIKEDTSVDLGDVESRLTARTRALLVTHYFGFPQDLVRVRAFCDAHRILLIEDCAHAFFGAIGAAPIGSFRDYAIASAWKFFPICDGGLLVSRRLRLSGLSLESRGLRFEAKALVNAFEQAFEYHCMNIARVLLQAPLWIKDFALKRARRTSVPGQDRMSSLSNSLGGWGFDAALVMKRMSIFSWFITRVASRHRTIQCRRRNYTRLLGASPAYQAAGRCSPLYRIA